MSKAIQCDRCKKFSVIVPDTLSLPAVADGAPVWIAITAGTESHTICDACNQDFKDFMANLTDVTPGSGRVRSSEVTK